MILNKFFILFKIGRKIGKSNIINIISETHKIPSFIKVFFNLLSFSFSTSNNTRSNNKDDLSASIQEMGTTFIKLGQFLATRPDIIGEKLSKKLESLQDKLPPFSKKEAEKIIIENLGQSNFDEDRSSTPAILIRDSTFNKPTFVAPVLAKWRNPSLLLFE